MKLRHIISMFLLFIAVMSVNAQLAVGSWKTFDIFLGVDKVVDTPYKIYYLTKGQLYTRDKKTQEIYNVSTGSRLNDSEISSIYYNNYRNSLVVTYSNANIDIIDDNDGRVYNMPDIMDAELDIVSVINDVDFDADRIYVATNFGVVVFDSKKKEVITAGNYGINMTNVLVQGDNLWLIDKYKYYYIDKNSNMTSVNSIKLQDFYYVTDEIMTLRDNVVVSLSEDRSVIKLSELNPDGVGLTFIKDKRNLTNVKNLQRLPDGSLLCHSINAIYIIDKDGNITEKTVKGSDLESKKVGAAYEVKQIASYNGLKELWLGSDAGLSCYSLENEQLTVLSEPSRPDNALTFNIVGRLHKGHSGAIYASSFGFSMILKDAVNPGNTEHGLYYINKIKDGVISDVTPYDYGIKNVRHIPYSQAPVGFKGGCMVLEDYSNPDYYLVGSGWDGYYYMKDGKEVVHYYTDNSTMPAMMNNYRMEAQGMDFDKDGNLWVAVSVDKDEKQFHMLEAGKVGKETTRDDWQSVEDQAETYHNGTLMVCKHSNNIFYIDAGYQSNPTILKTQGTKTLKDDYTIVSNEFIDQDGNKFSFNRSICLIEDEKGRVWLGTDNGVIEITRPDDINSSQFRINHLKVPRRDGTNFADYLLDGETVLSMAVDPSNRKWISTLRSGVYLVSEDGDEIIEHFDPTNSPIPSYSVFAVVCDDANNVYFGTAYGLIMYSSTSAPAQDDFSQVYAYPNPVRPDYTGWITITGLMDNSLVKIADAAGNVFHQSVSEGGMLVWDGCDRNGKRVKTGVYYVFASHGGEDEETNGAVTKILVVN